MSTVTPLIRNVAVAIIEYFGYEIRLPKTEQEYATVMRGFQNIAGLPHCVGAVDGSHIPWTACPSEQYFEYRCYKRFTSLVFFGVSDAQRRFIYVDCGFPGVMGDATIFNASKLKRMIDTGEWIGQDLPPLRTHGETVRPYLI